ncbi:carotenoid cleavage dioxygenase [Saccharopolyspora erythraea NRRL 2338]|uniref:Dioxygenase n=2 Tax=Saccharopolyspora erythraea TaxID=1836 RepID=A4F651_SACEN|nr:carotenoid oxygenase family protein [Saccharopolyspora erythraea]EQD88021.1 dioxygenase [Saccharopolyspora erythraea D]PFG93325.1 carotenoid cleavage dioxygenase [Saccharopolyspora erythraea NRRL 2338]QRK90166.1 carotenoid oxygenase family protein [Saccharopolyspora erythraea]CAL99525.1 putative dioxygenase [Saccharopolyspora erythraea NRRL 2338]
MTEVAEAASSAPPVHLVGHLEPVPDEVEVHDLRVTGTLPRELAGRYLRNGPNPLPGENPGHWFAGHGMVHGIRIRDGRAEWYRNRWVRTNLLEGRFEAGDGATLDRSVTPANTHVIEHSGHLLALCEGGLPYELTAGLDTEGPRAFDGRLTNGMTAHPKEDPDTGELHFFGCGFRPPHLTYHRLSPAGELVRSQVVEVPGATMMHDFAITENHVIWLDLPVTFDLDLVGRALPYRWNDDYGARLGVMARDGEPTVRWFEIDPCYVFHVGNAREDPAGRIVLDAVRWDRDTFRRGWSRLGGDGRARRDGGPAAEFSGTGRSTLHRWIFDLASGSVREQAIDDRGVEFPTLNENRVGRDNRYLYTVAEQLDDSNTGAAIVKYDTATGIGETHELGADRTAGEAVFVAAAGGRDEDDGWLLSIVSDRSGKSSDLVVLDATDLTAAPVATVHLPRRVPTGFHGSWIPDAELDA